MKVVAISPAEAGGVGDIPDESAGEPLPFVRRLKTGSTWASWSSHPKTDVSQGIGMGTTTGLSYFMPEWLATDDGALMSMTSRCHSMSRARFDPTRSSR